MHHAPCGFVGPSRLRGGHPSRIPAGCNAHGVAAGRVEMRALAQNSANLTCLTPAVARLMQDLSATQFANVGPGRAPGVRRDGGGSYNSIV